jgi:type IV secretory pathway VirB3-like protein
MRSVLGEAWTLAGVLLVIITLSGEVRTQAIWISVIALILWFAGTIIGDRDEDGDDDGRTSD